MGSCSSEQRNTKGLDGTFGSLVWVRRGNGSWWPGQIVDADEMSNGRLDAQKSGGVPIKLLGRDDVNVEYYNLEKTTKVKAFRCGDHDSCIEKAKAFAANPSNKRNKKAQRENAIILALELESASTSKDCNNNCPGAETSSGVVNLMSRNTSSSKENSDSALELSHSGISFEEANAAAALPNNNNNRSTTTAKRLRTPNDSEDDGNGGLKKRMKGLDDLGVGSNVKEPFGLVTESAPKCLNSLVDLSGSDRPPAQLVANASKGGSMPSFKKKRSKMVVQDIIKRKNRRRMLTKVFQKNNLVTVPITFDEQPTLPGSPYVPESNVPVNAESFFDKSLKIVSEEDPFDISPSDKLKDDDPSSKSELLGYDSLENLFDVPLINEVEFSDVRQGPPDISCSDVLLRENSPAEAGAPEKEEVESPDFASSPTVQLSCLAPTTLKDWQTKGKRSSRHHYSNLGPDTDPWRQPRYFYHPSCMFPEPVLYDVEVEVKAAHRPQHVPYISLRSKLNGKPITGHPIAVEVLEDGGSDSIVDLPGLYTTSGSSELEENRKPKTITRPRKKIVRAKKQSSSTKKTRTLSSLTGPRRRFRKERRLVVEKLKAPALACIPLKLVFSRINEALK